MDYMIIKQILDMGDISPEEKLSMISKIVKQFERIDNYTKEIASVEGRMPTLEDNYEAILKFAKDSEIALKEDEKWIATIMRTGLSYLMNEQMENGGWGRTKKHHFPDTISHHIKGDRTHPLATSWDTVMAIATLISGGQFVPDAPDVKLSILKGLRWLKENQDSNGAWRDVDRLVIEDSPPNILQTGMAICGLVRGTSFLGKNDLRENIQAGLDFLEKSQDIGTRGWPTNPGDPPDVKATSMSIIASLVAGRGTVAKGGVDWLITNQTKEGDWGYVRRPAYYLLGVYYGIEALHMYRLINRESLKKNLNYYSTIARAIRKALNWYGNANKLVRYKDRFGWIWKDGDEEADIENTAAAIIVLLNCAEDDFSFVIRKGIEWLINQRDPDTYWGVDTSMALLSLIKYVEPKSRELKI